MSGMILIFLCVVFRSKGNFSRCDVPSIQISALTKDENKSMVR